MPPIHDRSTRRLKVGAMVEAQTLETVAGGQVRIPDHLRITHLQFRRFAGCPICTLHLQRIVRRYDEIQAAGILEVVVFHSTRYRMSELSDLPFAVVADPERRLFRRFGVEQSLRAILDPRSWPAAVVGVLDALRRSRRLATGTAAQGGPFGLPADFLIGRDGRLLACAYGVHADDQWSVDELLELARVAQSGPISNDAVSSGHRIA